MTLVDPDPGRGAWHTAAGMLAPITELHYTETPLLGLNLASLARYPAVAAELTEATGLPTGYQECGTVAVAWDGADLAALRDLHAFARTLGVEAELLSGRELRALEPAVAPGLPGALFAPGDHQVDPRLVHAALLAAGGRRRRAHWSARRAAVTTDGDRRHRRPARRRPPHRRRHGRARRRQLVGPRRRRAGRRRAPGAPGQGADAAPAAARGRRASRGSSAGRSRARRSTSSPGSTARSWSGRRSRRPASTPRPRAGAVYELLRDAQSLLPELGEAALVEVCTGFRPGSPDNAPVIGPRGVPGLVHASGHYRNGVLLAPVTADGVAALIVDGALPGGAAPVHPRPPHAGSADVNIRLNGAPREVADGISVGALLRAETGSARGSAVVVDGEVVPRSSWDAVTVRDGQSVEIVTAVQGG